MQSPNLIRRITENRGALRKSEAKVADFVLAKPNDVIAMRIVDLAAETAVLPTNPALTSFEIGQNV